mmetsp:Transcript_21816/g.43567  ORF Transcript_21816/g.43567 Transcript_21816/m.43567 type:complete len:290 (-) Transcript_21816:685-1554(-)
MDLVLQAPDFALEGGAPVDQGVLAKAVNRGHRSQPAGSSARRRPPHLPQLDDLVAKLLALLRMTRLHSRELPVEDGESFLLLGHDLDGLDGLRLRVPFGILEDPHVFSIVAVAKPPPASVFHSRKVEEFLLKELDPPVPLPDHGEELGGLPHGRVLDFLQALLELVPLGGEGGPVPSRGFGPPLPLLALAPYRRQLPSLGDDVGLDLLHLLVAPDVTRQHLLLEHGPARLLRLPLQLPLVQDAREARARRLAPPVRGSADGRLRRVLGDVHARGSEGGGLGGPAALAPP